MRAKLFFVPRKNISTIKPDFAAGRGPDAHEQSRQCGFASSRRTNQGNGLARCRSEGDAAKNGNGIARCAGHDAFDVELSAGRRQCHGLGPFRKGRQKTVESLIGIARIDDGAPLRNDLRERGEHAPTQCGGDDHHAAPAHQHAFDGEPA